MDQYALSMGGPPATRRPRPPGARGDPRVRGRLQALFVRELEALGHPAPEHAADQLLLLIDGVLLEALTRPDTHPARGAKELAEHVLGAAKGRGRVRSRRTAQLASAHPAPQSEAHAVRAFADAQPPRVALG